MRCFLAGSKNLSVLLLEELLRQGHDVVGVLARADDDPAIRVWHEVLGHRSLRAEADARSIPVYQVPDINAPEFQAVLRSLDLDVIFSCQFNQMVKAPVLSIPRIGCINLHTALLPRNRGSFPMAWAIVEGEPAAGATLHFMSPGVDDGDIIAQAPVEIRPDETGASLYDQVTGAAARLIRETLPAIADGSYERRPQVEADATYHPRGYPYGGYVDPYWPPERAARFRRALDFPPFPGAIEPGPGASRPGPPRLYVMPGFDCDRPRGELVHAPEGRTMAEEKLGALKGLAAALDSLGIRRTFFVCGQFLAAMVELFGRGAMLEAFRPESPFVEIGHHSWSHRVLKRIPARPDKEPMKASELAEEIRRTQALLSDTLGVRRLGGFRAPLGYFRGLEGEYRKLDLLARVGVRYVSTDLRGPGGNLCPPLDVAGVVRQPYRYCNGVLEIPSHGWQDTAFSGTSRTPAEGAPRAGGSEIVDYYCRLFEEAAALARRNQRDFFLGMVLHPIETARYDPEQRIWAALDARLRQLGGEWAYYRDAWAAFSPAPARAAVVTEARRE